MPRVRNRAAWTVLGIWLAAVALVYGWMRRHGPEPARQEALSRANAAGSLQATSGHAMSSPRGESAGSSVQRSASDPSPRLHPLLREADDAVLAEGGERLSGSVDAKLAEVVRAVLRSASDARPLAELTIDYPQDEAIFPAEIVPPTFLWHEPTARADTWLIDVAFGRESEHVFVLSAGPPPPAGEIDPKCIGKTNEVYRPTAYQASAKSWTPPGEVWTIIKQRSQGRAATVTILGFPSARPEEAVSRGQVAMTTSKDPVGAPIFYRDVPLAPTTTEKGVIKPLADDVITLIAWRLRDISRPESRLLLTSVPRCTNCHSFSADGRTLGMDLDGPQAGKGGYIIAPISAHMAVDREHVIDWNSVPVKPKDHCTIGFLSQVSPDGRYAVTTVNEEVYVCNFPDFRFLQVFYPTRGILAYYSRETGQIRALPGADDPKYVHCDATWTPDGQNLVFARAEARDAYPPGGKLAQYANDPAETPIRYDLYRIPFNGGRGGRPQPIAGASNNGMSNSFPKVSPDGKWIVFVQCRNGQLMRPDSKLWIVPAAGGEARLMRCNTPRMNSWHSFSPNGRWLVFASKANTPYTQMFLTHIDESGRDSPAILIPDATAANRAVNIPEFVNVPYDGLQSICMPAIDYRKYVIRGEAMAKNGMLGEAIAEFDMAVRIKPDFLEGRIDAAVLLIKKGELEEARERLDRVLERAPNHSVAHSTLGVVLAKQGKLDEAIAHFNTALTLQPDYSEAHANLGRALQQKGRLVEATAHFRKALELDRRDPLGHLQLANVLLTRGEFDEAVTHLKRAIAMDPGLVEARTMLGSALASRGEFAGAVAEFQEALAKDPQNLAAVNFLARLLTVCPKSDVRDGARALQLIEPACAATGYRDPVLLSTLAAAYAEVGRFPEAIATATKALELVAPQDKSTAQRIRRELQCYREGKGVWLTW